MSTTESYISTDRECDHCGYNLRGLPEGSKCPECGTSIRRISRKLSGTMSNEAPSRFVRLLWLGFSLASLAIIGLIVVPIFLGVLWAMSVTTGLIYWAALALNFLAPFLWVAGIWLVTSPRPNQGQIVPDKVLDNDRYRLLIRLASAAWPVYLLVSMGISTLTSKPTPPSALLMVPLSIVHIIAGTIAWVGLMPTCVYFAELGHWASHDHLAQRLRSTAWAMAVFGTITVILSAIAALNIPPSAAAAFLRMFIIFLVVIAVIVFLLTIIQLTSVMKWVIKHQKLAAGSADRVRARIEREITSHGTIVTGLKCQFCNYDLDGLPFGGHCPECGESYADMTPLPILDPAKMHLDRDESEIEVVEGDNRGIYFNQELDAYGKPKASGQPFEPIDNPIPDEGDIPLVDEPPQDHPHQ